MRETFDDVLPLLLKHEGGFVNHPADPGGATNKGVTLRTYRAFIDPNGTVEDLKRITDAQLREVYRQHYWNPIRGDDLPAGVDYAVFDFAVNSGPRQAARTLQRVLGVPADGVIGPVTLDAVRKRPAQDTIKALTEARLRFLRSLRNGELWRHFGRGWEHRVKSVQQMGRALALEAETGKGVLGPWAMLAKFIMRLLGKG